jgi:hypothetical protein
LRTHMPSAYRGTPAVFRQIAAPSPARQLAAPIWHRIAAMQ